MNEVAGAPVSTEWTRATLPTVCGRCGHVIPVDAPMLAIRLDALRGGRKVKARCENCEGPAPPDLPLRVIERPAATPLPMVRFVPNMLPLDFKSRAAREPGDDD